MNINNIISTRILTLLRRRVGLGDGGFADLLGVVDGLVVGPDVIISGISGSSGLVYKLATYSARSFILLALFVSPMILPASYPIGCPFHFRFGLEKKGSLVHGPLLS